MGVTGIVESGVVILFVTVFVTAAVVGQRRVSSRPGYASGNESSAVLSVLAAAGWSFDKSDPRYRVFDALRWRLSLSYSSYFGYVFKPGEVALVAPFTEQWLSGDLAHMLSEEYDDEIRLPLLSFKAKMRTNGLWPGAEHRESAETCLSS